MLGILYNNFRDRFLEIQSAHAFLSRIVYENLNCTCVYERYESFPQLHYISLRSLTTSKHVP